MRKTPSFSSLCRVRTKPSIRRRGAPPLAGGHRVAWRLQLLAIPLVGPPCGRSTAGSAAAFSWERGLTWIRSAPAGQHGTAGTVAAAGGGSPQQEQVDRTARGEAHGRRGPGGGGSQLTSIVLHGLLLRYSMPWGFHGLAVRTERGLRPPSSWSPALGDYYKRDGGVDRLPRLGLASSFSTLRIRVVEVWAPYPTDGLNLLCKFTNMNFYMMMQVIADVRHWLCFSFSFSPGAAALSSPCLLCSCWEHCIVDYSPSNIMVSKFLNNSNMMDMVGSLGKFALDKYTMILDVSPLLYHIAMNTRNTSNYFQAFSIWLDSQGRVGSYPMDTSIWISWGVVTTEAQFKLTGLSCNLYSTPWID